MTDNYYAVIMAGGGGTRLWPLSRKSRPKQMLQLIDERTLFQIAVHRLSSLFPNERILVVTSHEQSVELRKQCPELQEENFLLEPQPRGTAAAIGLAVAYLKHSDPNALMAVLTADHYIGDEKRFLQYLRAAKEIALQGHLVTLGIEPTYPATQYGYIQQGETLTTETDVAAYSVKRFKEKPDASEAQRMLESGDHTWNSGMFIWQVASIEKEFERQMPDLYRSLESIAKAWRSDTREKVVQQEWLNIPIQTIDYGIMENAKQVAVIPARDIGWNDVGSWSSLFEVLEPDEYGNVVLTNRHINVDSRNILVHTNGQEHLVVTIGVEDLVVVDTGDVLFLCAKDRAQDVRQVIQILKKKKMEDYL